LASLTRAGKQEDATDADWNAVIAEMAKLMTAALWPAVDVCLARMFRKPLESLVGNTREKSWANIRFSEHLGLINWRSPARTNVGSCAHVHTDLSKGSSMKIERIFLQQDNDNEHWMVHPHAGTGAGLTFCSSLAEAKAKALEIINGLPERAIGIKIELRSYQVGWERPKDLFKVFPEAQYVLNAGEAEKLKDMIDPSRIARLIWDPT
jgi:hypothetical protein